LQDFRVLGDRRSDKASEKGRKEGFNMAEHENQQGHFFMGFLIGGVLGALAGIFFAPKSGKELRSDIKEKGNEVLKDAKEIYADASTKAEADRHLSEARQKSKEILARGEKKEGAASESAKDIPGSTEV
jgi:gas vesicle protein